MTGLPPAAIDNHCHVLDGSRTGVRGARYPIFDAPLPAYMQHLAALGAGRGVLVTASAHGSDNEPLLDALAHSDRELRGVAVVNTDATDDELLRLHSYGVRALRLQDRFPGGAPLASLGTMARRAANLGWHLEIWTAWTDHLDWLPRAVAASPVPVVVDHLGYFPPGHHDEAAAIDTLVGLARDGQAWITLSGAARVTEEEPAEAGHRVAPRVRRLLAEVPDRLLWGSDWPHVAAPIRPPTARELLDELDVWFEGDEDLLEQVTVANGEIAYGFEPRAT
ncbi:amidohydrolase family protein [Nocardioides cheoyonin]|uniref:amidohydrolase family protein n=1 Tax=Nocardioides cheoyonin TaxID=3156615 RepID=UPI0032B31276